MARRGRLATGSPGAVRLLLWHMQHHQQPNAQAEVYGPLLVAFVEHVVNAKTSLPDGAVAAYAALLTRVTHQEFSAMLLPALQRMVWRSFDRKNDCSIADINRAGWIMRRPDSISTVDSGQHRTF